MIDQTHVADYKLHDERLTRIGQNFAQNWRDAQYNLYEGGYTKSTSHHYDLAQKFLSDGMMFVNTEKNPNVNPHQVNEITGLIDNKKLTFVALNYPTLANFETFFYKGRSSAVQDLITNEIGEADNNKTLKQFIQDLHYLKLTANGEAAEQLETDIEVLESVNHFTVACDRQTELVQDIFKDHVRNLNVNLAEARKKLNEKQYAKYRSTKSAEIHSLSHRFSHSIMSMLNFSEN